MHKLAKRLAALISVALATVLLCSPVLAQRLDGTLRGEISDPSGAVIAGANVILTNQNTGVVNRTVTTSAGTYVFPNLLVGKYTVRVEASGFRPAERRDVDVFAGQAAQADLRMTVGGTSESVEVMAGAEAVQTDTSQLGSNFGTRSVLALPTPGATVLNLAVLAPNTTTQAGGALGSGGSVGGTRPRMNNFTVDGVDDNDVSVTGPLSTVIQDAVAEFNLVTNQFTAEFGHSAGGQFNIVTKTGTNDWHGDARFFGNNRKLNALDNLDKAAIANGDLAEKPNYDYFRTGGSLGGPIIKNRLFIYGAYEYSKSHALGTGVTVEAPTDAGLQALMANARNSTVAGMLSEFPTSSAATRTDTMVNPLTSATFSVPIGNLQAYAPNFSNEHDFLINGDLNLTNHRISTRYLYNRYRSPNTPTLPIAKFLGDTAYDVRKAIVADTWTIKPTLVNDFRVSYTRMAQNYTIPTQYANFPNFVVDDLGLTVGPETNSPQFAYQNTYQFQNNMTWAKGRHTLKGGFEWRHWIAPSSFLPRARGEWDYADLQEMINDDVPSGLNGALRGAGTAVFAGNQNGIYWFVQDDVKVTSRLTLNLGLRYEYVSNPRDANLQVLNQIASLPGVVEFNKPKTDRNNFAPRFGFAWDPTGNGKWAIRGGIGIAYDTTFQNLTLLQLPPQLQTEQNPGLSCNIDPSLGFCGPVVGGKRTYLPAFLSSGGLIAVNVPPTTQAEARSATQSLIVDTVQPRVTTWSLGVQRELFKDTTVEVRYLGTKSAHLPIQTRLNAITAFDGGLTPLPTYFSNSEVPATMPLTSLTQDDHYNFNALKYYNEGFDGGYLTAFEPWGSSIYHAGSVDITHRAGHGLYLRGNYTWAHNIDNSTNELFSSLVNPRRPQDFWHPEGERGRSVLDMRQKFALSWAYEIPKLSLENPFLKKVFHGWQFNGSYVAQSGQPVTALSGIDANGNWDSAGDRAIINPNGVGMTGTDVNYVCMNGSGATSIVAPGSNRDGCGALPVVAYVAQNSNARFVVADYGAMSNAGRDTIPTPGFGVMNLSLFKDTHITESKYVQFRVEMFNALNHRNFTLANLDVFGGVSNALSASYANVSATDFLNAKQFSGGNREILLGIKFIF